MLHNLSAEMARKNIDNKAVAEVLGCNNKTVKRKRSGMGDFSVSEARIIRNTFFPGMDLDYLFADDATDDNPGDSDEPDEPKAG